MPPPDRLRRAVRAVVVDEDERVLLVRLEFPQWVGWALPGGGVEEGEDDEAAIRRELAEEVGLTAPTLVGPIWQRTIRFADVTTYDGQTERIYLVRTASFEPSPGLTAERLRSEGLTGARWWTRPELDRCRERLAPSLLPALLAELSSAGPPATLVDVGE